MGKVSELQKAARIMGRAGGLKGGPARARKLTKRRRSEIAALGGAATKGIKKPRRK